MEDKVFDRQSSRRIRHYLTWFKDYLVTMHDARTESPLKKKRPHSCDLLISEKCNLRCVKCHFWKSDNQESVSIAECKRIIDSLSKIGDRPFELNLGGGEPLLIPGIIELIRYARKRGLQPALSTNATLITRSTAKKLARSGLSRMSISLDSLDERNHDRITGVPGTFKKVMSAIDYLGEFWKNGQLNIHTVLSAYNIDDVVDVVEWVNQHTLLSGINIQAVAQPFRSDPVDQWYQTEEYGHLWPPDVSHVHAVFDRIIEMKKKGYKKIRKQI